MICTCILSNDIVPDTFDNFAEQRDILFRQTLSLYYCILSKSKFLNLTTINITCTCLFNIY